MAMLRFIIGAGLLHTTIQSAKARKAFDNVESDSNKDYIRTGTKESAEYFAKQEFLPITDYYPDFEKLKYNKVKIIMAAGKTPLDKKKFYAQTVPELIKRIGCEMVIFPGHHGSFMDMPEEWTSALRKTLHQAKEMV